MKRYIAFLLLSIAVFQLFGCANSTNTTSVNFYYCTANPQYHSQASVIQAEQRKVGTTLSDLEGILHMYFEGPTSTKLISPFPAGTKLKTVHHGKEVTEIVLSNEIATLTGVELMLACASLASTVMEISQAEAVQIRAETQLLNNQEFIEFTAQSLHSFS